MYVCVCVCVRAAQTLSRHGLPISIKFVLLRVNRPSPLCNLCMLPRKPLSRAQMWWGSVSYIPTKDGLPAWAAALADA